MSHMTYDQTIELNHLFTPEALPDTSEPADRYDVCVRGIEHMEVTMSAVPKTVDMDEHDAEPVRAPIDRLDFHDDVTPAGIEALRDRAGDFLSKGKWKVIDGYVGKASARMDKKPA